MIEAGFQLARGRFHLHAEVTLPAAGVSGLFGASGCGKTTLLRCMAGLVPKARGRMVFDGATWQDDTARVFVPAHERGVALVFQHAALFPHLDVRANVQYALARRPASAAAPDFEAIVQQTGIGHLLDRAPLTLSGGERQRVAIARALASAPRLLLMDEPLSALDLDARSVLLPYLKNLHAALRIPVLYVSHNAEEIATLCDRVAMMEAGRVQALLTREEFIAQRKPTPP